MSKTTFFSCITIFLLLLSSCGSGGTGNAVQLPMNTAIVLSANLAQGRTQTSYPIRLIQVTLVLPQTATPTLDPKFTDGSLLIGDTGLKNLNSNGNILNGSYNSTTRAVNFVLAPNDPLTTDLGPGDIARLTCNISSGAQLSAQDIHPVYGVFGSMPDGSSVDLTSEIVPSVSIVTYQKP